MRRMSDIDGATANLSGLAPMQSKTSSATSCPLAWASDAGAQVAGAGADAREECRDAGPGLGAAVKPAPLQAHPPGEVVAGVDRHDKVLKPSVGRPRVSRPSIRTRDQHGLDILSGGAE